MFLVAGPHPLDCSKAWVVSNAAAISSSGASLRRMEPRAQHGSTASRPAFERRTYVRAAPSLDAGDDMTEPVDCLANRSSIFRCFLAVAAGSRINASLLVLYSWSAGERPDKKGCASRLVGLLRTGNRVGNRCGSLHRD